MSAPLSMAPYLEQKALWPEQGRHIMAHYDEDSIWVYQAYRPSIGTHAAAHGQLGGPGLSSSA